MKTIRVCHGPNCKKNNSESLYKDLNNLIINGSIKNVKLGKSFCMGMCAKGPNVKVEGNIINYSTVEKILEEIK